MIAANDNRPRGKAEVERREAATLGLLEIRRRIYTNRGRKALLIYLQASGTATADDVKGCVELPAEVDSRVLGAAPGPLARAGIIRRSGLVKSDRSERYGSYLMLWELIDRAGALRWLTENPDSHEPD